MPGPLRNQGLLRQRAAPTYLPILSSNAYSVIGAKRMVSGYNGYLYRLRRASDSATLDVSAISSSNPLPDYAAIAAWAGGADLFVAGIYEQASSGSNPAGTMYAETTYQPTFDLAQALAGCCPFILDGQPDPPESGRLIRITGLSLNRQNVSVFDVLDPVHSYRTGGFWELSTGLASNFLNCYMFSNGTTFTIPGLAVYGDAAPFGNPGVATMAPRSQPSVIGVTSKVGETRVYMREQTFVAAVGQSSATCDTLRMGGDRFGASYTGRARRWGIVVYPALSDADAIRLRDSLTTMFGIPTRFDRRVVFDGDSIMQQYFGTLLRNLVYYAAPRLTGSPEIFNMGVGGTLLADHYTNRVNMFSGLFTSAYGTGKCIIVEQAGINDLRAATTGANLYNNSAAPLATYLKGLGYKVGFSRILPCTAAGGSPDTATVETNRGTYNALLPGAADFLIDPTANATIGTYPGSANDTTYYQDGIHPTSAGFAILGPIHAAAINAA